jgi:hypothetical protein
MGWRFGERICVVCGAPPCGSVDVPPAYWPEPFVLVWRVPVCRAHLVFSHWPIRVQLMAVDEVAAVASSPPEHVEVIGL